MRRSRPVVVAPPAHRVTRTAAVTLGTVLLTQAACWTCNQDTCIGGFVWIARTDDDSGLTRGPRILEVTLEQTRYTIDCAVTDAVGDSYCNAAVRVDGDGEFQVHAYVVGIFRDERGSEGPAGGFGFRAAEYSDEGTRGPTEVTVAVIEDGQTLFEVDYEVTYVRDEEYFGDERCGYCERPQEREHTFSP